MPGPYRSKTLRTLVLPVQVARLDAEQTRSLEQEINGRLQLLKVQIGRAARIDDQPLVDALQLQRAELVAWHQLLLSHQQGLRHRRHIEFCERFQKAAQKELSPDSYQRLVIAAAKSTNN